MTPKKANIICGLTNEFPHVLEGIEQSCGECGAIVWLSYSSMRAVLKQIPTIKATEINPICIKCGVDDIEKISLTESQKEDLRKLLKKKEDDEESSHREL